MMTTRDHRVGPATCRVRRCNAMPSSLHESVREVSSVHVPASEQGKGYATTLMHKVCRDADAAGIVLVLWPQPYGDDAAMSREQLCAWYEREFGFVVTQPEPLMMARQPGATPRLLRLNPVIEAMAKEIPQ